MQQIKQPIYLNDDFPQIDKSEDIIPYFPTSLFMQMPLGKLTDNVFFKIVFFLLSFPWDRNEK